MPEPHVRAPEPHLRASDSDRAAVATALGEHMAAGRLTLVEYEERLGQVYATKTIGGLATLTADLPPTVPPHVPAPRPAPRPAAMPYTCTPWGPARHSDWAAWRRTAVIVLSIWAVTAFLSGGPVYFWPMWVIGPWGAVLLAQSFDTRNRPRRTDEERRDPRQPA